MPNGFQSLKLPALFALLLASSNQEVDKYLDTVADLVENTRQAIRSIRQGVQAIQQVLPVQHLGNSGRTYREK
ncbi:MAG: hypothetical protein C4570_00575 [Ammonifex sp.]|nr:MAG: hypothetical protein C4570_00575 [Ammonifex sp.]